MKLRYTPAALKDLDEALTYIAAQAPQNAKRVQTRIQTILNLLLSHPHIGTTTNDPTIRRITVTPYPYLVFYEVADQQLIIHAIRHSARNPSNMPGAAT